MASVASQLIEEVTAHEQRDSLEDAREICADGTYFVNNLRTSDRTFVLSRNSGGPTESIRYGSTSSLYCMGYVSIAYAHFPSSQIKRFRMALLCVLVPHEKVCSLLDQTDFDIVMP